MRYINRDTIHQWVLLHWKNGMNIEDIVDIIIEYQIFFNIFDDNYDRFTKTL